jgi:hypothetical protein
MKTMVIKSNSLFDVSIAIQSFSIDNAELVGNRVISIVTTYNDDVINRKFITTITYIESVR